MRHPRLIPLVAVAHGSRDPRAAATVTGLLSAVTARASRRGLPALDVRAAFLDHCAPSLPQVLGSVDNGPAAVVPLLLTAAYHSKADIPARLAAAAAASPGLEVASAGTLGPHPLLTAALERRLRDAGVSVDDAGVRATTSVVLAAAGFRPGRQRYDRRARGAVGVRARLARGRSRLRLGGLPAAC